MELEVLKEYARVIVKIGVNVQKGQNVLVQCSLNCAPLAREVVEQCYLCGANKVTVNWSDPAISRLHYQYQSVETLGYFSHEEQGKYEDWLENPPVKIWIDDDDPDQFKGIDVEKLTKPRKLRYPFMKPYLDKLDGLAQWTIVAMPSLAWAKKMYPNAASDQEALDLLEAAIMKTMRIEKDKSDQNWQEHIDYLEKQAQKMIGYHFEKLHYVSNNGTDFTIGLHSDHQWCTAYEKQKNGVASCVNMPSEEVFTLPERFSACGHLVASKPLSYNGNLIENFAFDFKDGKVIHVEAEKGLEHLQEMVKMDEGASYLGEVALVPYDSPINQIGVLFYNTLFDENAACHIALGDGISEAIQGHEKMSKEELVKAGCNESMIHVDFMVGTKDMQIIGIQKDGTEVIVFKDGYWAI